MTQTIHLMLVKIMNDWTLYAVYFALVVLLIQVYVLTSRVNDIYHRLCEAKLWAMRAAIAAEKNDDLS